MFFLTELYVYNTYIYVLHRCSSSQKSFHLSCVSEIESILLTNFFLMDSIVIACFHSTSLCASQNSAGMQCHIRTDVVRVHCVFSFMERLVGPSYDIFPVKHPV